MNGKDILNPEITPYAKCPFCRGLIKPDFSGLFNPDGTLNREALAEKIQDCPHCRVKLDFEREIIPGFIEYSRMTKAVSSGNSLLSMDLVLIVYLVLIGFQFFNGRPSILAFLGVFPLATVCGWFFKYGKISKTDEEYLETKKRLKLSLFLWLALNLLNLIVVIVITKK